MGLLPMIILLNLNIMDAEQFKQIMAAVTTQVDASTKEAVKIHVNGHIRDLTKRLDDYIVADTQWKKDDKEWKDGAQPAVTLGNKVITGSGIMKWILITGASFGSFLAAIKVMKELFIK